MELEDFPSKPFTARTALAQGIARSRLRKAVRDGMVRRVAHGIYLRRDIELTTELKLAAVSLVINPDSVACDRTAAWIWDVDVHEFRELDDVPPIESVVLSGHRRTERAQVRGGERQLWPSDWVTVNGVKVTTPVRTAMDLGCRLNRRPALAAMDALMRAHGFSHAELFRLLPRYFRRRGVCQLRELLSLVDPRAESQRESWVRLELHDHGLPKPEPQWWVNVDGVPTYRIDLAYPHARIAIEYNGEESHSTPGDRQSDAVRREWLEQHGWKVVVITKEAFASSADLGWIREVREALAAAQRAHRRYYARS